MQRNKIKPGVTYAMNAALYLPSTALGARYNLVPVTFADPIPTREFHSRRSNKPTVYLIGVDLDGNRVEVEPRMVLATWDEYQQARAWYVKRRADDAAADDARAAADTAAWAQVKAMLPAGFAIDYEVRKAGSASVLALLRAAADHAAATKENTPCPPPSA